MTQRNSKLKSLILESNLEEIVRESNSSIIRIYSRIEPIPKISDIQVLNIVDVIKRATTSHFGVEQYPSDESKLAFIFYSIVKGHFLENGNKRTASDIFILFLYASLYEKDTDIKVFSSVFEETAQKAIDIAISDSKNKELIIEDLKGWILRMLERLKGIQLI